MERVKRVKPDEEKKGGLYFAAPKENRAFIPSGSAMLDLALGGGWAEGRISNVIGDKASGKTLLAIGACAEFARKKGYEKDIIRYAESEAAFDKEYAGALGMPIDRTEFAKPFTVEDFFEDMSELIERCRKDKRRALYILDSMDALSDRAELERAIDEGTYGANKAKQLSEAFRRLVANMEDVNITLMIISQIRDKINATAFGRKWTRAGGRAIDFYSSQNVVIADVGAVKKTVKGIPLVIGRNILAKVEKNKIGINHREADFKVIYGYGIDDVQDCLDYLKKVGGLDKVGMSDADVKHGTTGLSKVVKQLDELDDDEYDARVAEIQKAVQDHWWEVERLVQRGRRKYR